jgi:purine nucleoside permease
VIAPRVVVLVYFEVGHDTGDRPGELQLWAERDHLDRVIEVPGMSRAVRANAEGTEIAVAVGPGAIRPAANVMALGLSPLFDLRRSYWLINGIAGVSPEDGTIGGAFWTDYVVNGDLVRAIDPREMPKGWPDGFYALDKTRPEEQPRTEAGTVDDVRSWRAEGAKIDTRGTVVRMNPRLMRWAYEQTKDVQLEQTEAMRRVSARFRGFPKAQERPGVGVGANLTTEAFWHGARMDAWAHRWVRYETDGRARFATTAENDSGAIVALSALTKAGRADWNRAMLLRTASNFDRQPAGMTAEASANSEKHGEYTGYLPALEAAYRVGERVVQAIEGGWAGYAERLPSGRD